MRSSVNYFVVILILTFSKCLLTQDVSAAAEVVVESSQRGGVETNEPAIRVNELDSEAVPSSNEAGSGDNIAEEKSDTETNTIAGTIIEDQENNNSEPQSSGSQSDGNDADNNQRKDSTQVPVISGTTDLPESSNGEGSTQPSLEASSTDGPSESTIQEEVNTTESPQTEASGSQCICDCNSGDEEEGVQCKVTGAPEQEGTTASDLNSSIDNVPTEANRENSNASETSSCLQAGDTPNPDDCRRYYSCTEDPTSGQLTRIEVTCPARTAFSPALSRCSRDISPCADDIIECSVSGNLPDPNSNTSYYWCASNFLGGFHKYRIECDGGEIFHQDILKCFIDIENIGIIQWNLGPAKQQSDRAAVKAEWKLLKAQEKAKAKLLRKKQKLEQKLQEEIEKKAIKDIEKQSKLQGSKEVEAFVCTGEGNFPSQLTTARYIACISKKGKLKAITMSCPSGHEFNVERGACILPETAAPTAVVSDDDSDDDDDD